MSKKKLKSETVEYLKNLETEEFSGSQQDEYYIERLADFLIESGMVEAEVQPKTTRKKKITTKLPKDEITLDIEDLRILIEKFHKGSPVWDELPLEAKIRLLLRERMGIVHPDSL